MLQKIISIITFAFIVFTAMSQSIDKENVKKHFENCTNEYLKQKILNSQKQYKVIYLFNIGCSAMFETFDNVRCLLKDKSHVDFFPITGQDISDDVIAIPFLDSIRSKQIIYRVERPKRKKFPIQFINMFKYTNKFFRYLNIDIQYKYMGIGNYVILDKANNVIFHTEYLDDKKSKEIYFKHLKEL